MKRDVDFLFEMGSLRCMQRSWGRWHLGDVASVTEHSFRVVWIALTLAKMEGEVDVEKIMKMALVHDICEGRSCDVGYLQRMYVERNEELAITEMFEDTQLAPEMISIWKEFEKRECIEAKIVKDADNLDIDLEIREMKARGVELATHEKWKEIRRNVRDNKLYTESARKIWEEITSGDPNSWHINAKRTRMTHGDWKNEETS